MEKGDAPQLQTVGRELDELRSELQELRRSKEEALGDLDRCRTELERTQEELRACKVELSALRQREQPKEEIPTSGDRYARLESGEGGGDVLGSCMCIQPRRSPAQPSISTQPAAPSPLSWEETLPLQGFFPEHDFSSGPLELTLEELKEKFNASCTIRLMAAKFTELSPGQSLQDHVLQRPDDDPMWTQFEVRCSPCPPGSSSSFRELTLSFRRCHRRH
jgi:hypothetical protein